MAAGSYAQKKAFKIIVVGSVGVGKTCILDRYVKGKYSKDHKSTLGTGVHSKTMEVDGTQIVMQIYDTAGQERFDSLVATYYRGSDAAFIVYDVSDRRSFEDVQTWYGKLRQHVPRPDGFPILVVGNKVDKPAESHQVTEEEGKQMVVTHIPGAEHMRTSAKENIDIESAFEHVARKALARGASQAAAVVPQQIKIDAQDSNSGGCAC